MALDADFLAAVLTARDGAILRRTDPSWILDEGVREALEWASAEYDRTGEVPPRQLVEEKFGLELAASEAPNVYWAEIKRRAVWQMAKRALLGLEAAVASRDPNKAIEVARSFLEGAAPAAATVSVADAKELAEAVFWAYQQAKEEKTGFPTPWPSMNSALGGGVAKGDLVVLAARTGIGKTFAAVLTAISAANSGAKVLAVSTEMGQLKIAQRLFAILLGVEPKLLRTGKLGEFIEHGLRDRLLSAAESLRGEVWVAGDEFSMDVGDLEGVVQEVRPDMLVIDGLYLIRGRGQTRTERMASVADAVKRLAKNQGVAVFVTHQFNREVDPNRPDSFTLERLGLSDVVAWNSDAVFALVRTLDLMEQDSALIIPLKVRDGPAERFMVRWDVRNVKFDEVGPTV